MAKVVDVAAAVMERPDGHYLLAQRPEGKVYAGWWEFPGGKVEAGEPREAALARELDEELGVRVRTAYPWITRIHVYEHATVRLHFFRVTGWDGEPQGREGQRFLWQAPEAPLASPMLPANAPVLRSLALPLEYAISDAEHLGEGEMLARLERRVREGLRLVQVRDKDLASRDAFIAKACAIAHRAGARVLVNGAPHREADGVHVTAAQLAALGQRPEAGMVGASCHTRAELERAMALDLDFAVLGPVLPTATHPGARALGWEGFAALARQASIPVYALGGLRAADLDRARRAGAHGLAMIRGSWA